MRPETWEPDISLTLEHPLRWKKPRTVSVTMLSRGEPFEFADRIFAVMACCQRHEFHVTAPVEAIAEYLATRTALDDSGRIDRMPQWYQVAESLLDMGAAAWPRGAWDRAHDNMPDPCKPLPNVHINEGS